MSQICSAYILSGPLLEQTEVYPRFAHSGSVVADVIGLLFTVYEDLQISANGLGFECLLCLAESDADLLMKKIENLDVSENKLRCYFEDVSDQDWPDMRLAVREGLEFIKRGCVTLKTDGEWLSVVNG